MGPTPIPENKPGEIMSGHSKWSSIKHKKAAVDAKRGKIFTKLIREITVAAKQGGGDLEANPRLRLAVNNARTQNMPNDTIKRAITKGAGGADGADYEEVIYEGYGPNNVAVVIETLTDNRNRTVASLRHAFQKHHGNMGATNSVQYMFGVRAVNNARTQNMPNDTIKRAITKGAGGADGADYEEVIYEGYGPNNVAVVIETLTDNRNRTVASLRHAFQKHHGNMGATNSVQYMFDRKGTMLVSKEAIDEETLTDYVLEAGAEDLEDQGDHFLVISPLESFESVKTFLEQKEVALASADLQRLPQTRVVIDNREDAEKVITFLEVLEDDDDVQNVFSNFDIDEAILIEMA